MRQPTAPQQLRAKRTRRGLLAAAREAFAALGYAGATVDDIARIAGYSKGAYYFHFATKEEVLLALVDGWAERRTRRLQRVAETAPVAALLEAFLASEGNDRTEPRLLLEFWTQAGRNAGVARRLSSAQAAWRDLLARAIERAQQAGDAPAGVSAEALAGALLALYDGLVVTRCLGAARDDDAHAALALLAGQTPLRATG
jgi:AcrR family transcriptional regulator